MLGPINSLPEIFIVSKSNFYVRSNYCCRHGLSTPQFIKACGNYQNKDVIINTSLVQASLFLYSQHMYPVTI